MIAVVGIIGLYKFSDVIKVRIQYHSKSKNYSNDKSIDSQLDSFINNAPRLLVEIQKEITEQRKNNVTDEQMKGLIQKEQMFKFLSENKEIIDIIGKPVLKKLVGFIKAI